MKKCATTIGALLVCIVGTMSVLSPAQASWSDCRKGHFCLWDDNTYSGDRFFDKDGPGSWGTGWPNNDDASSAANRSDDYSFFVFARENQLTDEGYGCIPRNHASSNLSNNQPSNWNDRISSMKVSSTPCSQTVAEQIGGYRVK